MNFENLQVKKDFYKNAKLSSSFFKLQREVYSFLDLEKAYIDGFFNNCIVPWAVFDKNGDALAILNTIYMDIETENGLKRAIQIGTVATAPKKRRLGLSKFLLKQVLEQIEQECDFVFLFANSTVLDFYPKFGFIRKPEYVFRKDVSSGFDNISKKPYRELNVSDLLDRQLLKHLLQNRCSLSSKFSVSNHDMLAYWYCIEFYQNNLYISQDEKVLLVAEIIDETLNIYDIVMLKDNPNFFKSFFFPGITAVVCYFIPDKFSSIFEPILESEDDDFLFVKGDDKNLILPQQIKVPMLAHT